MCALLDPVYSSLEAGVAASRTECAALRCSRGHCALLLGDAERAGHEIAPAIPLLPHAGAKGLANARLAQALLAVGQTTVAAGTLAQAEVALGWFGAEPCCLAPALVGAGLCAVRGQDPVPLEAARRLEHAL